MPYRENTLIFRNTFLVEYKRYKTNAVFYLNKCCYFNRLSPLNKKPHPIFSKMGKTTKFMKKTSIVYSLTTSVKAKVKNIV